MDWYDPIVLARIQFGFTVTFHIIFPAFSIGLASYLVVLEGLWLQTDDIIYLSVYNFWKKIFAIAFGMGVVSGLVMSYEFGTNWSVFADKTGPVLGPLLGYEVLSAFFLEAGFLGVMLFGLSRVGRRLHFFATLMVGVGTLFSAFWILSANSWMQTPAGYAVNSVGQFVPVDWLAVIFNPSFPYRFVHMVLAAYLTTAFVAPSGQCWCPSDVFNGDVDVNIRGANSIARGRPTRVEYTCLPAGENCGDGRRFRQPQWCAANPVRIARYER
jgi:cytochrome d ubiquinol oxidase subunit I